MSRHTKAMVLAAALVLVSASAALAGRAAQSPMTMILKKSDFPARTTYDADDRDLSGFKPRLQSGGVEYEAATATGLHYSSGKGSLAVTATVFTTSSVAVARKTFRLLRPPASGTFWLGGGQPLAVPTYGDEQVGRLKAAGSEGIWVARMVVRKRATVWALHVRSERRPPLAKSAVLTAFTGFARKQRSRVGNG